MRITAMDRRRAQLYAVTWEDGTVEMLDVRTMDEAGYTVGSDLSVDGIALLKAASMRRRAREKALYLLSVRDHSRRELQEKLLTACDADTAQRTVEQLEELGLLDDAAYAARLVQDLTAVKRSSRRQTLQTLQQRGIERDLAEEAVEAAEIDDFEQALALLRQKRYNRDCDEKQRRRMADFLARRGFSYDVIRRAMNTEM